VSSVTSTSRSSRICVIEAVCKLSSLAVVGCFPLFSGWGFPHPVLEQVKNMFTSILPTVSADWRARVEAEEAQ
jgi:hypothetical protein